MPLNGGGTASRVPGTTAVPNQTIKSADYNAEVDDIYNILNTARPIAYGGTGATSAADARTNLGIPESVSTGEAFRGHLYGLTLSNNSVDPTNDIDIAAGSAASDGTTPFVMSLASLITKRLDALWVVGTGNGGRDTGTIADTTYHMWLIQRSDTGVVDALFSTSATSPTMPANYDRKRRIGSVIREGGAIVSFEQNGDVFLRARATVRSATAAFASALLDARVPAGLNVRPLLVNDLRVAASSSDISISIGSASAGSADRIVQIVTSGAATSHLHEDLVHVDKFTTNTSAQIYYAATIGAGSINLNAFYCDGWIDGRGRQ